MSWWKVSIQVLSTLFTHTRMAVPVPPKARPSGVVVLTQPLFHTHHEPRGCNEAGLHREGTE